MSEENLFDSIRIGIDPTENDHDTAPIDLDKLRESIYGDDADNAIFIPELEGNQSASVQQSDQDDPETSDEETNDSFSDKTGFFRPTFIAAALIIFVLVAFGAYKLFFSSVRKPAERTILENVYIAGVDVGGMSRSQAVTAIEDGLDKTLYSHAMQIELPDISISIDPEDVGLSLDVQAAVDAAMEYGRSGMDAQAQAEAAQQGQELRMDILPYLRINNDFIYELLSEAVDSVTDSFQPSDYSLQGSAPILDPEHFDLSAPCQTLVLHKGIPGEGIDPDILYGDVLAAYNDGITMVSVTNPNTQRMPKELDLNLIHRTLTVPAKDAILDSKTLTLTPGTYGYTFDVDAARAALDSAAFGDEITIPMEYVFPGIKSDGIYCTDELASTSLACDSAALPYLTAACTIVNETIIPAGGRFTYQIPAAFRSKIGNCKTNPVADDSFCMLASALYQSALKAGLRIKASDHHSYFPDYCEKGMDVCISGENGLTIQNNSGAPVVIVVSMTGRGFTVQILGTETRTYSVALTSQLAEEKDLKVAKRIVESGSGYTDGQILQEGIKEKIYTLHLTTIDQQSGNVLSDEVIETIKYPGRQAIVAQIGK